MKDFNLHRFLRNNPLTSSKKKINEAFEGFGGVKGIAPIQEAPIGSKDPWGWEDSKETMKGADQSNAWIADIDRYHAFKGWTASWEHPGIILWSNPDVLVQVAATPGWDGEGTPIEIQYPTEDHVYGDATNDVIKVLDQDEFSGYDEYLNTIAPYLNSIAKKFAKSGEDTSMSEPFEEGVEDDLGYASHSGDFGDDDSEFETPIQRMNNLVNQNNLKMFVTGARGIMGDLLDAGFEPDEVYDFLIDTLRKVD